MGKLSVGLRAQKYWLEQVLLIWGDDISTQSTPSQSTRNPLRPPSSWAP